MKGAWYHGREEVTFHFDACDTVDVVNVGDKSLLNGDDVLCYHVHVPPGITRGGALSVLYHDMVAFTLPIDANAKPLERVVEGARVFLLFPTHQLELRDEGHHVKTIFVTLENNQLSYDDLDFRVKLEPRVDCFTVPHGVQFKTLTYIPLHPDDPLLENKTLAEIPQRTPTWFALRSFTDVSGSSFGKYCAGYWVGDDDDDKKDRHKTVRQVVRDRIARANNMRFGRIHEDAIMLIVMHNFPQWHYHEYGSIAFDAETVAALKLPATTHQYNCSPDGVAWVPSQTWDAFPPHIAAHYKSTLDCKRVLLEYKASYRSTKLPDYYIPQLYWGMMATRSCCALLVRYKRRRGQGKNGRWTTLRECEAYLVFRDPRLERVMLDNLRATLAREPHVTLATHTRINGAELRETLAREAKETRAKTMVIPEDVIEKHERKRYALIASLLP